MMSEDEEIRIYYPRERYHRERKAYGTIHVGERRYYFTIEIYARASRHGLRGSWIKTLKVEDTHGKNEMLAGFSRGKLRESADEGVRMAFEALFKEFA